jgi:hypothetical protein
MVVSCSDPEMTDNPYAAEFAAARQQTDVPEILAALEDGVITDAKYQQAVQLTIDCFADKGYETGYSGNGTIRGAPCPATLMMPTANKSS